MAAIGGTSCSYVHGGVPDMVAATEVWARPGIDGHGARTLGLRGPVFTLRAVKFGSDATVNSWRDSLAAIVSTIVTVTDDHNEAHTNCLVLALDQPQKSVALHAGNKRMEIAVTCQRMGT